MPTQNQVPEKLLRYEQWVCWRAVRRGGHVGKIPVDPTTSSYASVSDPETWSDFQQARRTATREGLGVGFVLSDHDNIVFIDLDHCRDPARDRLFPGARRIVRGFDSFAEYSPSGEGVHVLIEGSYDGPRHKRSWERGCIEVYSSGRFFTMTGKRVVGVPRCIEPRQEELNALVRQYLASESDAARPKVDRGTRVTCLSNGRDEEVLELARSSRSGSRFAMLFERGDMRLYGGDWSTADLALCNHLAAHTRDPDQIDRLVRQSALYRPKWDREDYRTRTILKALEG